MSVITRVDCICILRVFILGNNITSSYNNTNLEYNLSFFHKTINYFIYLFFKCNSKFKTFGHQFICDHFLFVEEPP